MKVHSIPGGPLYTPGALLLLLFGAFASAGAQAAPQPEVENCNVEVPAGGDVPWRLVRAEGFTFCVPGHWTESGKRTWSGDGVTVRWGTGKHRRGTGPFTVTRVDTFVVGGGGMRRPPVSDGARGTPPAREPVQAFSASDRQSLAEATGGEVDAIWSQPQQRKFQTGVNWSGPKRVHLVGDAEAQLLTALHFQIYRTVRFPR